MTRETLLLTLNPELLNKAVEFIENGNYAHTAFQALGVSRFTYYNWLNKGEKDINDGQETVYSYFYDRIKKAEGVAETRLLESIQVAAASSKDNDGKLIKGQWQAAAWILERKYFAKWGAKNKTEFVGQMNVQPIDIDTATEDELKQFIASATAALSGKGETEADPV
jgi:transposase